MPFLHTDHLLTISALAAQSFPHLVPDLDELDYQWWELRLCDVTKGYADPACCTAGQTREILGFNE